jgi:hypothetical protein
LGNIGSTIAAIPGQVQQAQAASRRAELENMQLADARARQAGEQVLDRSMQPYQPNGPQEEGAPPAPAQHPYLDDNNLWDIPKLSGMLADRGYAHLAPDLLASAERMNKSVTEHQDAVKKEADARTVMYGDYADGIQQLVKAGATPADAIETIGKQAVGSGRIKPQEFEQFKSQLLALPPDQLDPALNTAKSQAERIAPSETLGEGAKRVGRYGSTLGSNAPPKGKGGYTINGQRFAEDGTPIGAAVPKQADVPKLGSEEDFIVSYARDVLGKDPKTLTVAEKAEALSRYKEANADQEVRTAALAQKNLAAALAQLAVNQAPTPEQAASVADDLLHHRLAPEQMTSMFSTRGKEGLAFKLAVAAEAKKRDPEFNWEQASAEYVLSKSPNFQNTVRYMDAAVESIPRLEQTGQKLANGRFRSLNDLANAAKNQFNDTDLKAFRVDALLVGDEVAKILQGGGTGSGVSDAKLQQAQDIFAKSDSVPALASAAREVQYLIGNRRRALTRGTYMERTEIPPTAPTLTPGLAGLSKR